MNKDLNKYMCTDCSSFNYKCIACRRNREKERYYEKKDDVVICPICKDQMKLFNYGSHLKGHFKYIKLSDFERIKNMEKISV